MTTKRQNSEKLYEEALQHIVGGVNSPSRSYKAVGGGAPVFMKRGEGAYFWDVDDNRYIDYLAAYGPIITGHAHPHITEAIVRAAQNGTLYGTPTELEIKLARMLKEAIPSLDKVRFVNSGTEAVMTTIRVARAYTKNPKSLNSLAAIMAIQTLYSSQQALVRLLLAFQTVQACLQASLVKSSPCHLMICLR